MSLAKNLGGRVGVKKNLKILLHICDNPERFQNFSEKMTFFSQKSKKFLPKYDFWWGRVAFNKWGYFKPQPHPPRIPPPKLIFESRILWHRGLTGDTVDHDSVLDLALLEVKSISSLNLANIKSVAFDHLVTRFS
jgi:hypothetical protein